MKTLLLKTTITLSLVLLVHATLNAQAPGYMGKQFTAGYMFKTVPNFYNKFRPNKIHSGQVSYAVSRKISVQASFDHSNTSHNLESLSNLYLQGFSSISPQYGIGSNYPLHSVKIFSTVYGLDALISMGKYVAPVGTFINLGFSKGTAKVQEPFLVPFSSSFIQEVEVAPVNITLLRMGLNHRKVISEYGLFIIGGFELQHVLGSEIIPASQFDTFEAVESDIDNAAVGRGMRFEKLFNFKMGLGLIL